MKGYDSYLQTSTILLQDLGLGPTLALVESAEGDSFLRLLFLEQLVLLFDELDGKKVSEVLRQLSKGSYLAGFVELLLYSLVLFLK